MVTLKIKKLFKGYAALVFLRGNCFLKLGKGVGMCWQRLLNRRNGVCHADSSKCYHCFSVMFSWLHVFKSTVFYLLRKLGISRTKKATPFQVNSVMACIF